MRTRTVLTSGGVAAAAILLPLGAVESATADSASAARQPRCGTPSGKDFPIGTRIHGGPMVHHPGGGFEQWSVDLTNSTARACRNIHPVIVFAARDRGLNPSRLMLEFYDDRRARWQPAPLESTSEDELIGVLDSDGARGDQGGFTVPAKATLAVRVRLSVTTDTPPNQVTVRAAVVQRRGGDGDWVGESDDYRFAVLDDPGDGATITREELATTGSTSLTRLAVALGTVLLGGAVLALVSRRLRPRRR
ncbi:hypothetical protein [Streptomyces sp. NPDC059076]|uniref:hypothetical protein n=1 Tax=unclassified Streptomyces TaxID=2593676 RepID=UPI0036CC2D76